MEDVDDVKASSFLLFFLADSSSASETSRGRLSPTTPTAVDVVEASLVVSTGDLDSFVSSTALGDMEEEEASLVPFSVPMCALFSESVLPSFPSSLLVFSSLLFVKLADEFNPDEVVFSFSSILVNVLVCGKKL